MFDRHEHPQIASLPHASPRLRLAVASLTLLLSACSNLSTSPDWQLQQQTADIDYFTRQSSVRSLPEFRATIEVKATIPQVMAVLTDFSRQPDWVYRCRELRVIALKGYSEVFLYQINDLPIIADRDLILHGQTITSDDGGELRIRLEAVPDYCDNNDDEDCIAINQSNKVRVQQARGEFILTKKDQSSTTIVWQQFLDPGGALPHWLFRMMLADVPIKSLSQLKRLLEQENNPQ